MQTLQQLYSVSEDWTEYRRVCVIVASPSNVTISIIQWTFPFLATLSAPCNASNTHLLPVLSTRHMPGKNQRTAPPSSSMPQHPTLWHVQEVLGMLQFYARAVDSTMLPPAIGTLASQQAHGTKATLDALTQLLIYCMTHPDAKVCFIASDMVLHMHSDAS
jgi:hypothetical protein